METSRSFRNNFSTQGAIHNAESKSRFAQVPAGTYDKGKIVVQENGSVLISEKVFADEVLAFVLGCMKTNPTIDNSIKAKLGEVIDAMDARAVAKHGYSHSKEEAAHVWTSVSSAYKIDEKKVQALDGVDGVRYNDGKNEIFFDNENMSAAAVPPHVLKSFKNHKFAKIFIGYKKEYLGTILKDLAENFIAPTVLDLDLFYAHVSDDGTLKVRGTVAEDEEIVRKIFSPWKTSGTKVIFCCNELVIKEFSL